MRLYYNGEDPESDYSLVIECVRQDLQRLKYECNYGTVSLPLCGMQEP